MMIYEYFVLGAAIKRKCVNLPYRSRDIENIFSANSKFGGNGIYGRLVTVTGVIL